MKKLSSVLLIVLLLLSSCKKQQKRDKIRLLQEMFQEMVIKKDASKIPDYYSKEFLMDSNGVTIDYDFLLESHRAIYTTSIEYLIEYQEDTFLQQDDRVAGRMFITTKRPNEAPKRIEVILIVQYLDDKIYRIWELTYPDWSKLPAFESMSSNG